MSEALFCRCTPIPYHPAQTLLSVYAPSICGLSVDYDVYVIVYIRICADTAVVVLVVNDALLRPTTSSEMVQPSSPVTGMFRALPIAGRRERRLVEFMSINMRLQRRRLLNSHVYMSSAVAHFAYAPLHSVLYAAVNRVIHRIQSHPLSTVPHHLLQSTC